MVFGRINLGRGYSYLPPPEVAYDKQVLSLARASSEFGLTHAEVQALPVHQYRSCHGNSYPVWNKQQLSDARAAKQAREAAAKQAAAEAEERQLEDRFGGKEALAAHRAAEKQREEKAKADAAARAAKERSAARAELLRSQIADLQPGCLAPSALPGGGVLKTHAKKDFFLTDKDLKALDFSGGVYQSERLLGAAKAKHGASGFQQKRQAIADQIALARRTPLQAELDSIEARHPDLKVSERELAERKASKLETEAKAAEAAAAAAVATAKALRAKADAAAAKVRRLGDATTTTGTTATTTAAAVAASSSGAAASSSASDGVVSKSAVTPTPFSLMSAAAGKRKADCLSVD